MDGLVDSAWIWHLCIAQLDFPGGNMKTAHIYFPLLWVVIGGRDFFRDFENVLPHNLDFDDDLIAFLHCSWSRSLLLSGCFE